MTLARSLPKAHSTWLQLGFTLTGGLLLGGPSPLALLFALLAVVVFCAAGPAAILAGPRGPCATAEERARAWEVLGALAAVAAGLVVSASVLTPRLLVALHPPLVTGAFALVAVAAKQGESALGVLLRASARAAWAVPVAMASGAAAGVALEVWLAFTLSFGLGAVAMRGVLASAAPLQARTLRLAAMAFAPFATAALFALGSAGVLHASVPWGVLPAALFALYLGVAPPRPALLARAGWGLTAACAITTTVLVATLR